MANRQTSPEHTWGLVRMDGTSKLQWELKKNRKAVTGDNISPRLWKSDWRK